jgi:hypothetical protein
LVLAPGRLLETLMGQSERHGRRQLEAEPEAPTRPSVYVEELAWRARQRPLRPELSDEEFESLQRLTRALARLQD